MQENRDLINPTKLVGEIAKPRMSVSFIISFVLHLTLILLTSIAFIGQCVHYRTTHPKIAIQKELKEKEQAEKERLEREAFEAAQRKAQEKQKAEAKAAEEKKDADAKKAKEDSSKAKAEQTAPAADKGTTKKTDKKTDDIMSGEKLDPKSAAEPSALDL